MNCVAEVALGASSPMSVVAVFAHVGEGSGIVTPIVVLRDSVVFGHRLPGVPIKGTVTAAVALGLEQSTAPSSSSSLSDTIPMVLVGTASGDVMLVDSATQSVMFSEHVSQREVTHMHARHKPSRAVDVSEDVLVVCKGGVVVRIDAIDFQARVAAARYNSQDAKLKYGKWALGERVNDCVCSGLVLTGLFAKSPVHLSTYNLVAVGAGPAISLFSATENEQVFSATTLANKVGSAVLSWGMSFLKGAKTSAADGEAPKQPELPAKALDARVSLRDGNREIERITPDPASRLALCADNLGRVLAVDLRDGLIMRIWKGYRETDCGWIAAPAGSPAPWLAVMYLPRRGLLEIWNPLSDTRVGAYNVGEGFRLVPLAVPFSGKAVDANSSALGQFCGLLRISTGHIFAINNTCCNSSNEDGEDNDDINHGSSESSNKPAAAATAPPAAPGAASGDDVSPSSSIMSPPLKVAKLGKSGLKLGSKVSSGPMPAASADGPGIESLISELRRLYDAQMGQVLGRVDRQDPSVLNLAIVAHSLAALTADEQGIIDRVIRLVCATSGEMNKAPSDIVGPLVAVCDASRYAVCVSLMQTLEERIAHVPSGVVSRAQELLVTLRHGLALYHRLLLLLEEIFSGSPESDLTVPYIPADFVISLAPPGTFCQLFAADSVLLAQESSGVDYETYAPFGVFVFQSLVLENVNLASAVRGCFSADSPTAAKDVLRRLFFSFVLGANPKHVFRLQISASQMTEWIFGDLDAIAPLVYDFCRRTASVDIAVHILSMTKHAFAKRNAALAAASASAGSGSMSGSSSGALLGWIWPSKKSTSASTASTPTGAGSAGSAGSGSGSAVQHEHHHHDPDGGDGHNIEVSSHNVVGDKSKDRDWGTLERHLNVALSLTGLYRDSSLSERQRGELMLFRPGLAQFSLADLSQSSVGKWIAVYESVALGFEFNRIARVENLALSSSSSSSSSNAKRRLSGSNTGGDCDHGGESAATATSPSEDLLLQCLTLARGLVTRADLAVLRMYVDVERVRHGLSGGSGASDAARKSFALGVLRRLHEDMMHYGNCDAILVEVWRQIAGPILALLVPLLDKVGKSPKDWMVAKELGLSLETLIETISLLRGMFQYDYRRLHVEGGPLLNLNLMQSGSGRDALSTTTIAEEISPEVVLVSVSPEEVLDWFPGTWKTVDCARFHEITHALNGMQPEAIALVPGLRKMHVYGLLCVVHTVLQRPDLKLGGAKFAVVFPDLCSKLSSTEAMRWEAGNNSGGASASASAASASGPDKTGSPSPLLASAASADVPLSEVAEAFLHETAGAPGPRARLLEHVLCGWDAAETVLVVRSLELDASESGYLASRALLMRLERWDEGSADALYRLIPRDWQHDLLVAEARRRLASVVVRLEDDPDNIGYLTFFGPEVIRWAKDGPLGAGVRDDERQVSLPRLKTLLLAALAVRRDAGTSPHADMIQTAARNIDALVSDS